MGLAGLLATIFIHENYVPKPNVEKLSISKLKEQIPEFNSIVALCIASFIYAICIMSLQPVILSLIHIYPFAIVAACSSVSMPRPAASQPMRRTPSSGMK